MVEEIIYLDNNASSPVDPEVIAVMQDALAHVYANPSSTTHALGRRAAEIVENSRSQIAQLIGAHAKEIVFTSGSTESNNLAILGLCADAPNAARVITCAIEHKSVLAPVAELGRRGAKTTILPVNRLGRIDLDMLKTELRRSPTRLVSIQAANSEIGTRQDIRAIADLAHDHGAAVHCDATQAVGRVGFDAIELGIDFASFNAHKMHGPKGVGALFVLNGPNAWPLRPLLFGGSQESGVRPGTLDAVSIAGFGKAASLSPARIVQSPAIAQFRDQLERSALAGFPGSYLNGDLEFRLPGTSSLVFPGADAEPVLGRLGSIALSTTSACNAGAIEPSHVLMALGMSRVDANQTLRVAVTMESLQYDARKIGEVLARAANESTALN